jgi:hypothetical protein
MITSSNNKAGADAIQPSTAVMYEGRNKLLCLSLGNIVKQCFWIQIKFITADSNAIHTIITTI